MLLWDLLFTSYTKQLLDEVEHDIMNYQNRGNQPDVELDMINAISAADITFIMSSSQAIVNWLNALDQSDFS